MEESSMETRFCVLVGDGGRKLARCSPLSRPHIRTKMLHTSDRERDLDAAQRMTSLTGEAFPNSSLAALSLHGSHCKIFLASHSVSGSQMHHFPIDFCRVDLLACTGERLQNALVRQARRNFDHLVFSGYFVASQAWNKKRSDNGR